jgi:phosphoenolpyruvate---glycerone phosphotransferase subunit DhaL
VGRGRLIIATSTWSAKDLIEAFERVEKRLRSEEAELGRLDAIAGDGDLGVTLRRGFERVVVSLREGEPTTPEAVLNSVGATLSTEAPSTLGTLLATGFREAARVVADRGQVAREDVVAILEAASNGIARRGDVEAGERTVLDAMLPAVDAARSLDPDADIGATLAAAAAGAANGAEATKAMEPRVGRASWVGSRVVGSPDGGAVAWAMILEAMADVG